MTSATDVVLDYLAQRSRVRQTVSTYIGSGMRAQSFDSEGGTRAWCFSHGDEVTKCHDLDRCALHILPCACKIKTPCQGEPIQTGDPTGEAALTHDAYRSLMDELDRWERTLSVDLRELFGRPATLGEVRLVIVSPRHDNPRSLTPAAHVFARALTLCAEPSKPPKGHAHDGAPGCQSCSRLKVNGEPWWSEPNYYQGRGVNLGGILKAKMRLCRTCQAWIVEQDRLPTLEELRHRHDDPRGRWPRRTVKTRRAS